MSNETKHVIIHYLDEPVRILYWTKEQMAFYMGVPLMGMAFEMLIESLVVTILGAFCHREYRKRFKDVNIQILMYWFLPQNSKNKYFPENYKRDFVG